MAQESQPIKEQRKQPPVSQFTPFCVHSDEYESMQFSIVNSDSGESDIKEQNLQSIKGYSASKELIRDIMTSKKSPNIDFLSNNFCLNKFIKKQLKDDIKQLKKSKFYNKKMKLKWSEGEMMAVLFAWRFSNFSEVKKTEFPMLYDRLWTAIQKSNPFFLKYVSIHHDSDYNALHHWIPINTSNLALDSVISFWSIDTPMTKTMKMCNDKSLITVRNFCNQWREGNFLAVPIDWFGKEYIPKDYIFKQWIMIPNEPTAITTKTDATANMHFRHFEICVNPSKRK